METEYLRRQRESVDHQKRNLQTIIQRQRTRNRQRALKLLNAALLEPLKLLKLHLLAKGWSIDAITILFIFLKIHHPVHRRPARLRHVLQRRFLTEHVSNYPHHRGWCVDPHVYHCRLRNACR